MKERGEGGWRKALGRRTSARWSDLGEGIHQIGEGAERAGGGGSGTDLGFGGETESVGSFMFT